VIPTAVNAALNQLALGEPQSITGLTAVGLTAVGLTAVGLTAGLALGSLSVHSQLNLE